MPREPQRIGPQERLLLLKRLMIAEGLPADGFVPLAQHAVERRFATGATVIEKGASLTALYLVVEGRLAIDRGDRAPTPIERGEVTGALEVMAHAPSLATIRAVADTLLLEIPANILFDVLEDHFGIFMSAVRNLAEALLEGDTVLTGGDTADPSSVAPPPDLDDLVQRLLWLRGNSLFARSRLGSLVRFAAELETVTAPPGTRLWARGDRASWILFLARGQIRCTFDNSEHLLEGPGLYIGALEPLAERERRFDADVSEAVVGLRLGVERLTDLLEDDFALAKDLLAELAGRLLVVSAAAPADPVTSGQKT
jgi:CRP-like cAMP-binding protein